MIELLRNKFSARSLGRFYSWLQGWLAPALLRRRTFRAAAIASLVAIFYWGLWASDRYVSESHIVIQRTDISSAPSMDVGSLLTGASSGSYSDQMLLRDYLLSVDMLQKLDERLDLRSHYSDSRWDIVSRMWGRDRPVELFYNHYISRVSVEFDERGGVLVVKAQGYTPEMAQAITAMMVEEGESYMNLLMHRLAKEQVHFLEQQVDERAKELLQARQALLSYQSDKGLVSPQATIETLTASINQMEARLSELRTTRSARLGYLSPTAPAIIELDVQIKAIERQISREKSRLTSADKQPLNQIVEEYQRLQMASEFAQETYKTALNALESGRVDATRTLKKVSIISKPNLPQYPLEPRRLYNIVVFILLTLILAGITHLLAAIIRDHQE